MKVLLASGSPRRKQLLQQIIPDFDVAVPIADENYLGASPEDTVITIATRKAEAVEIKDYDIIIASDTMVYYNGTYFGKPKDAADASKMLKRLAGNTHQVITALVVKFKDEVVKEAVTSFVTFNNLCDKDIENYIINFNPLDKAGAYAIQDNIVVKSYSGDYNNIVGLPICALKKIIEKHQGAIYA